MSAGAAPPAGTPPSKAEIAKQIRFGTEMAQQGNWHEAIFRWRRALASDPDNPRLHNNIAVAYESLGQYDKADSEYRAAAAIPGAPDEIARNRDLFEKFYMRYREAVPARAADAPGPPPPPASSPPLPPASSPPPSATVPPPPAEAPTEKPKEPDAKAP
jgi:hypothetical protein